MLNKYEIHSITIGATSSSSSVVGEIKTNNYGHVNGKINTEHTSTISANGRLYAFKQRNAKYPFMKGNQVIFNCKKNKTSGVYRVVSFVDNSNGTKHIISPFLYLILISGISLMILKSSEWSLTPFLLPFLAYYLIAIFPFQLESTNKMKNLYGVKDKSQQKKILKGYSGLSIVGASKSTSGKTKTKKKTKNNNENISTFTHNGKLNVKNIIFLILGTSILGVILWYLNFPASKFINSKMSWIQTNSYHLLKDSSYKQPYNVIGEIYWNCLFGIFKGVGYYISLANTIWHKLLSLRLTNIYYLNSILNIVVTSIYLVLVPVIFGKLASTVLARINKKLQFILLFVLISPFCVFVVLNILR